MDTIQSSIVLTKIKYLKQNINHRTKIALKYNNIIDKINSLPKKHQIIQKPKILEYNKSIYAQYTIKTKYRDKLKKYLEKNYISTTIYYEKPVTFYSYYKNKCKYDDIDESIKISKQVLSLPINEYQSFNETNYICEKLYSFFLKLSL